MDLNAWSLWNIHLWFISWLGQVSGGVWWYERGFWVSNGSSISSFDVKNGKAISFCIIFQSWFSIWQPLLAPVHIAHLYQVSRLSQTSNYRPFCLRSSLASGACFAAQEALQECWAIDVPQNESALDCSWSINTSSLNLGGCGFLGVFCTGSHGFPRGTKMAW